MSSTVGKSAMKESTKKRRRAEEAPVWVPRQPGAAHVHVKKHQQRDKGLEVVFDPKAHKEYLTGFHKRKVARRKEALKNLEKRQREQRLEERAERRQAMKEEIARLGADVSDSEDEDEEHGAAAAEPEQRVYTSGQLTSTVTVMPIRTHSDSEDEGGARGDAGSSGSDEDGEEDKGEAGARRQQHQQQRQQGADGSEGQPQQAHGRKLSKTALRIMTKTKLKVEGKRAGGGGKGGGKKGGGSGSGGGKKGRGGGGGKRGGKGGGGRGGRR